MEKEDWSTSQGEWAARICQGEHHCPKEQTQALAKYNKDETRAQRILIESIKDSLIPYVSKF